MKVTIGLPVYENFKADTTTSLLMALREFPHDVAFAVIKGGYIDTARETIMRYAVETGADKLVFVDSDMVFRPDSLCRIVSHHKAIIGAAYNEKKLSPEGGPITTVKFDDGKGGYFGGKLDMPTEPFMCAAVATGFLALHLPTITAKMQPPYFEYDRRWVGAEGRAGEDTYFCQKAREAGLEVWCDPTLVVKHIGDWPY